MSARLTYTSSLAAHALNSIGIAATDLEGAVLAWASRGRPMSAGQTVAGQFVS